MSIVPVQDRQRAALRHGVAGVGDQVKEKLAQVLPVALDDRQFICEFAHDRDALLAKVVMDKLQIYRKSLEHLLVFSSIDINALFSKLTRQKRKSRVNVGPGRSPPGAPGAA